MAHNKVFKLKSPVQGYHYFRQFWIPEPEQFLNCYYERGDAVDRFPIKICESGKEIAISHLPRVTKILIR